MAEAAAIEKRTFIQPLDMSSTITMEELMQAVEDSRQDTYPGMSIDPELAWELFKAFNLGEAVFSGNKN
jgi:hypothetical protein